MMKKNYITSQGVSELTLPQSRFMFDKLRYNKGLPDLLCFNPNLGGVANFIPLCWFSLNNSETVKATKPWDFAAFSN